MGWVKGNQVIASTDSLAFALLRSSGIIGIDYNSMMTTDATGRLVVKKSSGLAGGHELNVIGWDAISMRFWVRNSWGRWGMCRSGEDCGYAWISPADMITLRFDANAPVLQ
jgi:C1A family cysteine protease